MLKKKFLIYMQVTRVIDQGVDIHGRNTAWLNVPGVVQLWSLNGDLNKEISPGISEDCWKVFVKNSWKILRRILGRCSLRIFRRILRRCSLGIFRRIFR